MAWIFLLIAGGLEVAWAVGLKRLGIDFSLSLGALTLLAMVGSLVTLYLAMARLPLGIAYPIWTGIGSVGSVVVGVLLFHQVLTVSTVVGVSLLVLGMIILGANAH